jgi:hypothetical protein
VLGALFNPDRWVKFSMECVGQNLQMMLIGGFANFIKKNRELSYASCARGRILAQSWYNRSENILFK